MTTLEELESVLEKIKKENGVEIVNYGDDDDREPELTRDYYDGYYDGKRVDAYAVTFLVKSEEEEDGSE